MSEFEKSPEQYAESISIETPFESMEQLKKIFEEGKMLCWSYNQNDFRLKIWLRLRDSQGELYHRQAHPDADIGGYISKNLGIDFGSELFPKAYVPRLVKNSIRSKLEKLFP